MKFIPFEKRADVDHNNVLKIGTVTVWFLKESDDNGLTEAAKLLAKAYENRMQETA